MTTRVLGVLCVLGLGCVANGPVPEAELSNVQRDGLAELGIHRVEMSVETYFLYDIDDELVGTLDGFRGDDVIAVDIGGTLATVAQREFETELACGESRIVRTIDEHGSVDATEFGDAPTEACLRAIDVYRLLVAVFDVPTEDGARVDALASSGSSCSCVEDYFGNCDTSFCHMCIPAHWSSCGGGVGGGGGGGGGGGIGGDVCSSPTRRCTTYSTWVFGTGNCDSCFNALGAVGDRAVCDSTCSDGWGSTSCSEQRCIQ